MNAQPEKRGLLARIQKPEPQPETRLPEWRRRALEAHRRLGWVAAKEVVA